MTIAARRKPNATKPNMRKINLHTFSRSAVALAENAGLSREELSQRLNINPKTLERRLERGVFEPGEAIFLEMIERIQTEAQKYFDNPEDVRDWLNSPIVGLDNKSPLESLVSIQGYDRVREALVAQAYGMFA